METYLVWILSFFISVNGFLLANRKVCFDKLGCFTNNEPFNNALDILPDSPDNIGVTFTVYTRDRPTDGVVVHYDDPDSIEKSGYDGSKPTKFIIHGYMSYATSQWVVNITRGFLRKRDSNLGNDMMKDGGPVRHTFAGNGPKLTSTCGLGFMVSDIIHRKRDTNPRKSVFYGFMVRDTCHNCLEARYKPTQEDANVITVNWKKGASRSYQFSVANTRTVGAMGARLLGTFRDKYHARMEDVHLTGHSLGAQTCGYIGRRVPNVGRITGFDPAGPLFENHATEVRLDPSDALFVDVIHSDALPLEDAGFGTKRPSGHIDFYPNGGGHQPGCPPTVKTTIEEMITLQFSEAFDSVACNHQRSYVYFAESLEDTNCQFTAYPCNSYQDFTNGKCTSCGNGPCPIMGYYANLANRTGSFYLTTNSQYPFCRSQNVSG